jgi:hypothetical protein
MSLYTLLRRSGAADPLRRSPTDPPRRPRVVRLAPLALAGTAAGLLAGGGYALASGGNAVTVCVKHHGGTVYRARTCHRHDGRLTLSRTGRTGRAGRTGPTGKTGPAGPAGVPGPTGVVLIGTWSGKVQPIAGKNTAFVFAGPTTTLTTTAGQAITASGSAALATSQKLGTADLPTEDFSVSICRQASAGGPVSVLDGNSGSDFEEVTATTTRIPFAVSMSGAPGAGSWRVGMCVQNANATDLDHNDFSVGTAFVTNAKLIPPPAVVQTAATGAR